MLEIDRYILKWLLFKAFGKFIFFSVHTTMLLANLKVPVLFWVVNNTGREQCTNVLDRLCLHLIFC